MTAKIDGFQGQQFLKGDRDYTKANQLYATSSHGKDHDMNPGLIVQPQNAQDIIKAINHAKQGKLAISIVSGGHQYSGACSTSGNNIMMDLRQTFKGSDDLVVLKDVPVNDSKETFVYTSVSQSLGDFNAFLAKNGLFVPHGQCAYVHVGGHGQTGGYGQLGRSFGLFGDHIQSIRMYDHNAQVKEVRKDKEAALFYAILGGSPGNFGIITHYTIRVHRDADHQFGNVKPYAAWAAFVYSADTLKKLLKKVAAMADDVDFPRNYDLCVSALSSTNKLAALRPRDTLPEEEIIKKPFHYDSEEHDPATGFAGTDSANGANGGDVLTSLPSDSLNMAKPSAVVVYAQWVPFSKDDKMDPKFFDEIKHAALIREYIVFENRPMSYITGRWLFHERREFNYPYDKRTYMTNSNTLVRDGWHDVVTERIDMVMNRKHQVEDNNELYKTCYLAVQIQPFGGKYSQFRTNANNGTSYSWRDSTVCQVLDCFYSGDQKIAAKWQEENDAIMNGPKSCFSKQDKRVLWGSYGEWDLDKAWQYYYEDRGKYERIGKARAAADPNGTFTPNPFAVKRA